jgi:ArsR family transcriptional regulator, arsenate/arsenite/antimonite-responsive transcriptional repressor
MLAALAQESRLRVFRRLAACDQELSAGALAEQLELPANTLSFHLKELAAVGLIQARREGRSILYSLKPDGVRDLIGYLCDDCCGGRPELCGVATPKRAKSSCC